MDGSLNGPTGHSGPKGPGAPGLRLQNIPGRDREQSKEDTGQPQRDAK